MDTVNQYHIYIIHFLQSGNRRDASTAEILVVYKYKGAWYLKTAFDWQASCWRFDNITKCTLSPEAAVNYCKYTFANIDCIEEISQETFHKITNYAVEFDADDTTKHDLESAGFVFERPKLVEKTMTREPMWNL